MAEQAICNASPLIFFSRSRHLELLGAVVGRLLVPAAVAEEIRRRGPKDPTAKALGADWMEVVSTPRPAESILAWGLGRLGLGPGETWSRGLDR